MQKLFKINFLVCILLLVIFSKTSLAQDGPINACDLSDVIKIQRPIHPNDPNSQNFQYSFRFIEEGDSNLPVVIFIPGGPGESSITSRNSKHLGFRFIWTDPRGAGCNSNLSEDGSSDVFSTENLASDIIAIINTLKLKNYILHGHSYGTVLTTEVAARIGNGEALFQPTAVVLSGVLGKAFTSETVYQGSQEQWSQVKADLPNDVLAQLSTSNLPFGANADQWGRAIAGLMGTSASINPIFNLKTLLLSLQTKNPEQINLLKTLVLSNLNSETPQYTKVNRPIWCREISESDNTDLALVNGELLGNRSPDYCKGFSKTKPYDSKEWQISAPIFYFQGAKDNLTTLEQARYHYLNQRKSKRFFITLPEDSHIFPLCSNNDDALWRSIAKQGAGFETILQNCLGDPLLEISKGNE